MRVCLCLGESPIRGLNQANRLSSVVPLVAQKRVGEGGGRGIRGEIDPQHKKRGVGVGGLEGFESFRPCRYF